MLKQPERKRYVGTLYGGMSEMSEGLKDIKHDIEKFKKDYVIE